MKWHEFILQGLDQITKEVSEKRKGLRTKLPGYSTLRGLEFERNEKNRTGRQKENQVNVRLG